MESIQEGRGYGVNTGGKGLSYSLRLLSKLVIQQSTSLRLLEHIPREPGDRSSGGLCSCSGPGGLV